MAGLYGVDTATSVGHGVIGMFAVIRNSRFLVNEIRDDGEWWLLGLRLAERAGDVKRSQQGWVVIRGRTGQIEPAVIRRCRAVKIPASTDRPADARPRFSGITECRAPRGRTARGRSRSATTSFGQVVHRYWGIA
jgi:hypothetical protein